MTRPARLMIFGWLTTCFMMGAVALAVNPLLQEAPPPAVGAPQGEKAEEEIPEFKKEAQAEQFETGKKLFVEKEFSKAASAFKKAGKGGKSKKDKAIVKKWSAACQYGRVIVNAKKRVDVKDFGSAYQMLLPLAGRIQGSPAEAFYNEVNKLVEAEMFLLIEGFNFKSTKYTRGKKFNSVKGFVFEGAMCLRWQNTRDRQLGQLKVEPRHKDWSNYEALQIWIHTERPGPSATLYIRTSAGAAKKGAQPTKGTPMLQSRISFSGRPKTWTVIEVPFEKMKKQGNPTLSAVQDVLIQIPAGRAFDFYVDAIRLKKRVKAPKQNQRRRR